MKKNRTTASALWKSGGKGGTISVSTESGAHDNPAELIGSALVSSFSRALSKQLGLAADVAGEVASRATVTSENLTGGWTITDINLNVDAKLPKVTQGKFIDATVHAKTNCMVCRLLRVNISMNAKLAN
jgi:osmotically inducible protein OsmC